MWNLIDAAGYVNEKKHEYLHYFHFGERVRDIGDLEGLTR
jgi:hypothetical protein